MTGAYYDEPDAVDVAAGLREVAETLARDCAGAIQIHGPRHARYYDTKGAIHPRALNHVTDAGGHFAAVENLPAPDPGRDDLTWHGSDIEPGVTVAAFEFSIPADPVAPLDRDTALVAHEALDQLLILSDKTAMDDEAIRRAAADIESAADIRPTPRTRPEPGEGESRDGAGGTRPVPPGASDESEQ